MELSALLAFAGVATMLAFVPGPDWAFIVAASVRERAVIPAVTGVAAGYGVLTVVVAVGVGPLVASEPAALAVITIAGAAYLFYLGVSILRSSRHHRQPVLSAAPVTAPGAAPVTAPGGDRQLLRRGIGVSALNPKGLLFFVAFLPQFARPASSWPFSVQLIVLGAVYVVINAIFYGALGFTADRTIAGRPRLAGLITRVAGVGMIVVSLILLSQQVLHSLSH